MSGRCEKDYVIVDTVSKDSCLDTPFLSSCSCISIFFFSFFLFFYLSFSLSLGVFVPFFLSFYPFPFCLPLFLLSSVDEFGALKSAGILMDGVQA